MNEPCTIRKIISRDCRANSTKLLVRDRANSHSVQLITDPDAYHQTSCKIILDQVLLLSSVFVD